jgi:hypothetical protein
LIRRSASAASLCGFLTPAIIASIIRRPLTPMLSLITESSLMLASSSVFWMRRIWLICSRLSCLCACSSA